MEPNDFSSPRRGNKGLINLSRQVWEKVRESGVTTGNRLAKEIIHAFPEQYVSLEYKNVQRRVYDALNVLHAQGIITKDRNEIHYKGLSDPHESSSLRALLNEKLCLRDSKRRKLAELFLQIISLTKLVRRNQEHPGRKFVEIPFLAAKGKGLSIELGEDHLKILGLSPIHLKNDTQVLAELNLHEMTAEELGSSFSPELIDLLMTRSEPKELTLRTST